MQKCSQCGVLYAATRPVFTLGLAEIESITWTYTIANVRLNDPDLYCADVQSWAEKVLADTACL